MNYLEIELEGIDENGEKKNYKLSDFEGENVILYFYPEDDTPVCTKEAYEFRDSIKKLNNYATVIGVSKNDTDEHLEFQKKHKLNFIMLSDKLNELKEEFKKHLKESSEIHRTTFILDDTGEIIKIWEKVDVEDHINEIIKFFEKNNK